MNITLQMDAMGNLHVWKQHGYPTRINKYIYVIGDQEADYFFQDREEYNRIFDFLHFTDREELDHGWPLMIDVPNDLLEA